MSFVLWLTGLPCSGKTTLAKKIVNRLEKEKIPNVLLDGDEIRSFISADLDFSHNSRNENVSRVAGISKLLLEQGIASVVSILSPLEKHRNNAYKIIGDKFNLIYLNTSIEVCEKRDVKGMYKLARENKIKDFTGVGSIFEKPKNFNIEVNTGCLNISESTNIIIEYMKNNSLIKVDGSKNEKLFEANQE